MKNILLPVARSIFRFDECPWFMPPDELDDTQRRMQRERANDNAAWQHQDNHAFHDGQQTHLSLRL